MHGAFEHIVQAGLVDGIFVSTVSAWEIGMLCRKPSGAMSLLPSPHAWFARMTAAPGIKAAPFTAEIAIGSSSLPGALHQNPADRLLIATARDMGILLCTRDENIVVYAAAGHVDTVRC